MRFEWDAEKNRRNRAKHKISFEAAWLVFGDPWALNLPERVVEGEERWQTIGMAAGVIVLLVVHADREGRRRGCNSHYLGAQSDSPREETI